MSEHNDGEELLMVPHSDRLGGIAAVITGAGSAPGMIGVGAATSVVLAAAGASIALVDIDWTRAEFTRQLIERVGGVATVVCADLTQPDGCEGAVAESADALGGVDVLVNNAAISPDEEEGDFEVWQNVLNLNLVAVGRMTEAASGLLAKSAHGSVVNISSTAGIRGGGALAYSASKGGVVALSRALALRHGRSGVRVNCVVPGHLYTPMGIAAQGDLSGRELRKQAGMLGTEGTPWDVALAVLFLASDEARWITAVTLSVDAGSTEALPLAMSRHMRSVASEVSS
jgi:NAD(P)-dependent dehydrogenase (short-subunit alcohol dehydrogenase family)